jgi:hypothetical protein
MWYVWCVLWRRLQAWDRLDKDEQDAVNHAYAQFNTPYGGVK